ncbi:hypothetical protein ACN95_14670 [Gordonia sihwensis]|nr:hypothetical protein [Gordonia sihwensis]
MPLMPERSRMLVILAVPIEAILRAWDYLTPDIQPPTLSLSVVEQMMPLEVWGAICAVVGVVTVWGFAMRWPRTAIAGLRLGGATYGLLALGQWLAVVDNPWFDGVRSPAITTIFPVAYWGLARGYTQQMRSRA